MDTNVSRKDTGFTVLELLVSITILAIATLAALPASTELYDSFHKRNAEMQLLEDLRRAQASTVQQGCQGIITIATGATEYSFGCDYAPFSTDNPPTIETVLFTHELPTNISVLTDDTIIFNTRGQVVDSDGFLSTRTITLQTSVTGDPVTFSIGTLRATGFFSFTG